MRLFLTSTGLSTKQLRIEFVKFVDKKAKDMKIAYITTARNPDSDKSLLEAGLRDFEEMGVTTISLVDIEIETPEVYLPILEASDVIWITGGNTFYLMDQIRKRNLEKDLRQLLTDDTRVLAGDSAGSIVAGPMISIATVTPPDDNAVGLTDHTGMNLVSFELSPHTPNLVTIENAKMYAEQTDNLVVAIDDKSAIEIIDDVMTPIGNGIVYL